MANFLRIKDGINLGSLNADPGSANKGDIYFNTSTNKFRFYDGSAWQSAAPESALSSYLKADGSVDITGVLKPTTDGDIDLGTSSLKFADIYAGAIKNGPVSINMAAGSLISTATPSIDWFNRLMINGAGTVVADWSGSNIDFKSKVLTKVADGIAADDAATKGQLAAYIPLTQKAAALGVATLDSNGKIPSSQIPAIAITDTFVVADQTAMLALSTAETGDVAIRTDVSKSFILAGTDPSVLADWKELLTPPDAVTSVNSQTGAVSLDTDDISEGSTNLYFTAARAKTAAVVNSTAGSETDQAASVDAMKSYVTTAVSGFLSNVVEDTTPELGGNLDVNGFAIEDTTGDIVLAGQNSVKRAKQATKANFIEEEYIHSIGLSASQTNTVISALTFAHGTYDAVEIVYRVKESTSGDNRIGTLRVVTDGTNVSLSDVSAETADTGIDFSAAVNGANIEIKYSSGSNGATLRADVKKFLV